MMTCHGTELDREQFIRYIRSLVNRFYKILPLKEECEPTLTQYVLSLQREMLGCQQLVLTLHHDDRYIALLAILQYLSNEDVGVAVVKTEVFRAINILKQLQGQYARG